MGKLIVTTREGRILELHGTSATTVMEVMRDGGVDEIIALCGGNCACATCHVHVDALWLARLPVMNEDESELLDNSSDRVTTSRLSCQIPFTDELDGLAVTVAAED